MRAGRRTGGLAVGLAAASLSVGPAVPLSAQSPAVTVDTVVVASQNVFDDAGDGPGLIARLANALHVRTRPSVVRRTLLVRAGDPYDSARVAESERALRALKIFRMVAVDTARVAGRLGVRVATADGWSTKPEAGFSTAGGDETWRLGVVEQNFLGTATQVAVSYQDTPDRRAWELSYLNPHFVFRKAALWARYKDLSDGRRGEWRFGVPFYQTAARRALELDGEAAEERVLVFRDGVPVATPQRRALRFGVTGGFAPLATSRDYLRLWLAVHWRREDFAAQTTTVFPRSVYGAVGAGVEIGHARFRVLEHFNSYARREDVDLSQTLRVGVWGAPRAWGYAAERAGIGPELRGHLSAVWRGGFAVLRAEGHGVSTAAGLDSGRVGGSLTVASQNLPRQTLIFHVQGGAARRPKPGAEFDSWLDKTGPRLFGAHAFTGTRMLWLAIEDRVLVADELWDLLGVGLAPFFEWGGAWYADEPARLGGNAGISLRLGPTRSVGGGAGEIALGYRFGDGFTGKRWAVAVRKGFAFLTRRR